MQNILDEKFNLESPNAVLVSDIKYIGAFEGFVFEYIEPFYNTVRSHRHCEYLSPNQYEAEYLSKMEKGTAALAD